MASSRNRRPKPDPADAALLAAVQRAVAAALARPPAPGAEPGAVLTPSAGRAPRRAPRAAPLLLAFSGGPDSTVLLDLAARLRDSGAPGFEALRVAHVHHGLHAEADAWAEHCARECERRGLELDVCRVRVGRERGTEAAAREARYEALLRVAHERGARLLLTAHHADDRIETFLLQWLRGAGPAGLAGVAELREAAPGGVRIVRPLLEIARPQIDEYLARHALGAVQDPSNHDARYARNALRLLVVPQLARIRSGFRKSAARSIDLVGEAADVLHELAGEGVAACTEGAPAGMLRIDRLAGLAPARRGLVLRAWLAQHGIEAPPRARLREVLEQAIESGSDARMLVRLGARELRRHRGLLCLRAARAAPRGRERLVWSGEPELPVAGWGGVLRFSQGDGVGFDPQWLRQRPLEVRARTGGERLKPHPTRPSRRLKHLYQEAGVPEFERAGLPLLWRDDQLIYVARIGADARLVERGAGRVRIEWHGEGSLLLA